jgi:hypothetical protein
MKLNIVKSSIALLVLIWVLFYFKCNNSNISTFDDKYKIDSISKENKYLSDSLKFINNENIKLIYKNDSLKFNIYSLKEQKKQIKIIYKDSSKLINNFHVSQLDSFYKKRYGVLPNDSIVELQKHQAISGAKDIVAKDSLLQEHRLLGQINFDLETLVHNQDTIINNYIKKDSIYSKIINNDSVKYKLLDNFSIKLENSLTKEKRKNKKTKVIGGILVVIALLL